MPDEIDAVTEQVEASRESAIADIVRKAKIPKGEPGECQYCFEEMPRLVNGACGFCRDKYDLA